MNTKVWNLMYEVGNTGRIVGDAGNPQMRAIALEGAEKVAEFGWRVWVEHHESGKRIFESQVEKDHVASKAGS